MGLSLGVFGAWFRIQLGSLGCKDINNTWEELHKNLAIKNVTAYLSFDDLCYFFKGNYILSLGIYKYEWAQIVNKIFGLKHTHFKF